MMKLHPSIHTSDSYSTRLIWYFLWSLLLADPIFFIGFLAVAHSIGLIYLSLHVVFYTTAHNYTSNLIKIGSLCQKIGHLLVGHS